MSLFKTETPPPIVPRLEDVSENYKSTNAYIAKLENEIAAEEQEFFNLRTNANDDSNTASRVADLVEGKPADSSPDAMTERQTRLSAIQRNIPDKIEAIHLLRQKAAKERSQASREITDRLKGDNDRLSKEIVDGLVRINAAMVEMRTFSNALAANDVITNGLFVAPDFLPNAHDSGSALADYLREAVELGFISKLPVSLLHKSYSTQGLPANGHATERNGTGYDV